MKHKLVILADVLDTQIAGIHYYLRRLLDALYKLNSVFEITLIRPFPSPEYPKWDTIVIPINKMPLNQRWRQFTSIPRIINKINPDIVLEPAHFGPFRLIKSIKRATVIHDLTPITHPQFHKLSSTLAHKLLLKSIIKTADCIITDSQNSLADLNALYPGSMGKSSMIHLAPSDKKQLTINQEEPYITKPYILCVGTIEPRKNHIQLIAAFEKIESKDLKLVLVGQQGWKSEKVIERIDGSIKKDKIILADHVSDQLLCNIYQHAEMMVYPSFYEGFGLPIVEAMQYGLPVLCSDSSCLPEVGGDAANYFPLNDSNSLAKLIDEVYLDKEKANAMRNKSHLRSLDFSWQKTATEMQNILKDVI